MRDFNAEARDLADRKYAYDFDYMMHEFIMQTFSPWLRGDSALELGCYHGEFTERICARYTHVVVVDAASECIEIAKRRVSQRAIFIRAAFEDEDVWRQPAQIFDAIFLIHTLEHVDDPLLILKRCREWLAPGGRLFLAVPNANAASRQIAVHMDKPEAWVGPWLSHNADVTHGEAAHGHRRTYSLDTLERDARNAGLGVVHRGGVLFKPLANFQIDKALAAGVIDRNYLNGCFRLGMVYPDLCSSIYLICERQ